MIAEQVYTTTPRDTKPVFKTSVNSFYMLNKWIKGVKSKMMDQAFVLNVIQDIVFRYLTDIYHTIKTDLCSIRGSTWLYRVCLLYIKCMESESSFLTTSICNLMYKIENRF